MSWFNKNIYLEWCHWWWFLRHNYDGGYPKDMTHAPTFNAKFCTVSPFSAAFMMMIVFTAGWDSFHPVVHWLWQIFVFMISNWTSWWLVMYIIVKYKKYRWQWEVMSKKSISCLSWQKNLKDVHILWQLVFFETSVRGMCQCEDCDEVCPEIQWVY